LVEELRRDLPNVKDRHDPEAEVMKQAADPHVVIEALEKSLVEELTQLQQQDSSE
jgi:dGTP triphosphohydrolase